MRSAIFAIEPLSKESQPVLLWLGLCKSREASWLRIMRRWFLKNPAQYWMHIIRRSYWHRFKSSAGWYRVWWATHLAAKPHCTFRCLVRRLACWHSQFIYFYVKIRTTFQSICGCQSSRWPSPFLYHPQVLWLWQIFVQSKISHQK